MPLYRFQDLAGPDASAAGEEAFAHLQFATCMHCTPLVDPFRLGGVNAQDSTFVDNPVLKIRAKGNLEVGKAPVILSSGERPTMEEYVRSTEAIQLKMLEKVRKKVRIGALKYR